MGIITWIIFGFFVGILARMLVPGGSGGFVGCLPTIALGVIGSVLGGFIGRGIGLYDTNEIHGGGIFMSILGAVIVLVIYGATIGRRNVP
jgi:uncharacterized membrane protein YeaQ/YmgE (transglycosylase-associated protein family)